MLPPAMRVLHVLSQRPGRTGSGVTLEAIVREASAAGHEQRVAVGTPAADPTPAVAGLAPEAVLPLRFGRAPLEFALPGMSDVMPYPSSRWRDLTPPQLDAYRGAWRRHLAAAIDDFRPDLIHAHHLWVLSAILKDVAPSVPVVVHGHATGLRQMVLCPHLANDVARRTAEALDVPATKVHVVGAGYREDLFHPDERTPRDPRAMLFVGKYSRAKGLPWLLDAFERLSTDDASLTLHVAGGGGGGEAAALADRMDAMAPHVVRHGHFDQPALADLAPRLGTALDLVALPVLRAVDEPHAAEVPAFVDRLEAALVHAIQADAAEPEAELLVPFTWRAVFDRIGAVWRRQIPV